MECKYCGIAITSSGRSVCVRCQFLASRMSDQEIYRWADRIAMTVIEPYGRDSTYRVPHDVRGMCAYCGATGAPADTECAICHDVKAQCKDEEAFYQWAIVVNIATWDLIAA